MCGGRCWCCWARSGSCCSWRARTSANLLLARGSARQAELAVRSALGAGRVRLVRQLLTEAVVLGAAGATLGLAIAYAATRALVAMQPADLPRLDEVSVNGVVVSVTFAIAIATSLAFGVLPALQFSGKRLPGALRQSTRGAAGGGGQRVRAVLVVAEMAVAVVLLVGAGLLIRSFVQLTRVDPGFRPDQALSFRVALQSAKYRRGCTDTPSRAGVRGQAPRAARGDGRGHHQRAAVQRPRRDGRLRGRGRAATAAERERRDRDGQRHAGLLPGHRRGDSTRPSVHGRGPHGGAAGRHRQRGRGTPLVRRSGSDRPSREHERRSARGGRGLR